MQMTGREIGHYHVLEPLGEGGMAVVYKAYDTHLERTVALKVIRVAVFSAEGLNQINQRFEREAKALARLSHPNIVGVIDYGEFEGAPYLVMEYLSGGSLKDKLDQPMPWQQSARFLLPVARALAYAHTQNIVHRDVKPSNILTTQSGEPMLTDFGIAKILDLGPGQSLTSTGVGIGTPEYMAPEQGMGGEVDPRADVYALGVVFYEMVTGRRPYEADTPMAVVFKSITDPLPRPSTFIPGLPEEVEQVLIKALAKQPEDRFQTMDLFASALEKLAGGAISSQPAAPPLEPVQPVRAGAQAPQQVPPPPPAQRPAPTSKPPVHPSPPMQAAPSIKPAQQPQPGQVPPLQRAGQPPAVQGARPFPPPPAGAPHLQPMQRTGGPLPQIRSNLPPIKRQMPAWLAVILTIVILGGISVSCWCILQLVVQGMGSY